MTTNKKSNDMSVLDQMADDVDSVELPTEYPPGCPEFKVYLAIRPRSRRGEFKNLLADLAEMNPQLRAEQAAITKLKNKDEKQAASMRLWARMDEMYELVERALRIVAVDTEKFNAWAESVSDEELQIAWAVYQQRTQPGEASSSAS